MKRLLQNISKNVSKLNKSNNINFNCSIFKNFYRVNHLGIYMGIISLEGVVFFFSFIIGPIRWINAIGIHCCLV